MSCNNSTTTTNTNRCCAVEGNGEEKIEDKNRIEEVVRDTYGRIADEDTSAAGCCGAGRCREEVDYAVGLGYSSEECRSAPDGANLGLGCGNPSAIATLKPGETVLDLGSGAGFDCFLAANRVGPTGRVIGVDMTAAMIEKARVNAGRKNTYKNVEFRLGEIENLPVADSSVDVVISNCVINLSANKRRVFHEIYRVLKAGGRFAVSDMVAVCPMPENVGIYRALYAVCVAGALLVPELREILESTGFTDVRIDVKQMSREFIKKWFRGGFKADDYVSAANIEAVKKSQ